MKGTFATDVSKCSDMVLRVQGRTSKAIGLPSTTRNTRVKWDNIKLDLSPILSVTKFDTIWSWGSGKTRETASIICERDEDSLQFWRIISKALGWLAFAIGEFSYNNSYHVRIKGRPYEATIMVEYADASVLGLRLG
ncbi:hypothetical protein Tco_0989549 [Tanacetum coccineum]|uniref:Uncharacterized protein n=1 Tax=Tanacetum coccineum TaxID=301880 RepID=A0ABQ5EV34_9ASTR